MKEHEQIGIIELCHDRPRLFRERDESNNVRVERQRPQQTHLCAEAVLIELLREQKSVIEQLDRHLRVINAPRQRHINQRRNAHLATRARLQSQNMSANAVKYQNIKYLEDRAGLQRLVKVNKQKAGQRHLEHRVDDRVGRLVKVRSRVGKLACVAVRKCIAVRLDGSL